MAAMVAAKPWTTGLTVGSSVLTTRKPPESLSVAVSPGLSAGSDGNMMRNVSVLILAGLLGFPANAGEEQWKTYGNCGVANSRDDFTDKIRVHNIACGRCGDGGLLIVCGDHNEVAPSAGVQIRSRSQIGVYERENGEKKLRTGIAMPRRERPPRTSRSEHWLRLAANDASAFVNERICKAFGWPNQESIEWLSPVKSDQYAEYYDEAFLARLGIDELEIPLHSFWPRGGPRWDGLARTSSRKFLLVEAKAYIEEGVDFRSKAGESSRKKIAQALQQSKQAYGASTDANWESPFYQYANRLAHLYFLVSKNEVDAYLVFMYFANAPDVPSPCSSDQWEGARRLTEKCLGLGRHDYRDRVATVVIDVREMKQAVTRA